MGGAGGLGGSAGGGTGGSVATCGDGIRDAGHESCDDGNNEAGDGCSPTCTLEETSCGGAIVDLNPALFDGQFRYRGTTVNAPDHLHHSCVRTFETPERIFSLWVEEASRLEVTTDFPETEINTIVAILKGSCANSGGELVCIDTTLIDGALSFKASATVYEVPARTQLYIVVAGYENYGRFELVGRLLPLVPLGSSCHETEGPWCEAGSDCIGSRCSPIVCGDGITSPPEHCEPALYESCPADCMFPYCGDGIVNNDEICDDGNTDETDSCIRCTPSVCGDGIVSRGEECDDGSPDGAADGCVGCRLGCPAGGNAYRALPVGDRCFVSYRALYHRSSVLCLLLGGSMAVIRSAEENTVAMTLLESPAWLGLNDQNTEGAFQWSLFEWSTGGEPVGYTNWAPGEPKNVTGQEDCVEIALDGSWTAIDCAEQRSLLCQAAMRPEIAD